MSKLIKFRSVYLTLIMFILLSCIALASPQITVNQSFVKLKEYSSESDSFIIYANNFNPNENITLKITIDGNDIVNDLGNIFFTIYTDANGSGQATFKPKLDSYAGRVNINITSPAEYSKYSLRTKDTDESAGLTIERVKRQSRTVNGHAVNFDLYYTNQSIEYVNNTYGQGDLVDVNEILIAAADSYVQQAGTWGFNKHLGTDYDPDNTIQIYANDGKHYYHKEALYKGIFLQGYPGTLQNSYQRIINNYPLNLKYQNYYVSEAVHVGHEHFHFIEYSYSSQKDIPKWDYVKGGWYFEGMARFIETIIDPSGTNQPNSLFFSADRGADVNNLMKYPNEVLTVDKNTYGHALLWGFLYNRTYGDISVFEKILDKFTAAGNNPEKDGPQAISNVLSSVPGYYKDFEDLIVAFWTAVYEKDFYWEGKNWSKYLDNVQFRSTLNVTKTKTASTGGDVLNRWAAEFVRLNFSSDVSTAKIKFIRDDTKVNFKPRIILKSGTSYQVIDFDMGDYYGNLFGFYYDFLGNKTAEKTISNIQSYDDIVVIVTNAGQTGSDFGYTLTAESADWISRQLRINNTGDAELKVDSVYSPQPWLSFSNTSLSVQPGVPKNITVTIDKNKIRATDYSGQLYIHSNDPSQSTISVPVLFSYFDILGLTHWNYGKIGSMWQAKTDIEANETSAVEFILDWPENANISLNMMSPSGINYSETTNAENFTFTDGHPKVMMFEYPQNGTWIVRVNGGEDAHGMEFRVEAKTIPSDVLPTEINFSDARLNYISTCKNEEQGLRVLMKGDQANATSQIINIAEVTNQSIKAFLAGLVIPNGKLWLSLPKNDVSIDPIFAQTEAAQILLDADVKLKRADQDGWTQIVQDSYNYWDSLIQNTSYYNKVTSNSNWYYPEFTARRDIIPGNVSVRSLTCDVYFDNFTLLADTEIEEAWADYGGYGLNDSEMSDVNSKLEIWKEYINNESDNLIEPELINLINYDDNFSDFRRVYVSLVLAQWYKNLDRDNLMFADLIDSENLTAFNLNTPFNKTYWQEKSYQNLYNGTLDLPSGNFNFQWYGGIDFSNLAISPVIGIEGDELPPEGIDYDLLNTLEDAINERSNKSKDINKEQKEVL